MSQVHAIRNPEGVLVNTNCFREEALHFLKVGYYTPDKWGSPAWKEYWEEQLRRCAEGYSSGGVRVTGDHYAYLNFGQIKITQEFKNAEEAVVADRKPKSRILKNLKRGAQKVVTFPSFWDMDYNYYWVLDIARWGIAPRDMHALELQINPLHLDGGYHIIVGKSRRKGFSYKNGFVAANRYNTVRNSITLIGAFDKKYLFPEGTMKMTGDYINFFNEFTGWAKARDYVDKTDHKKASYSEKDDNSITVEKGYKSTVMALSFKDNPEAAIGKDGTLVLFEEAGKFPNLEEAYMKTKPAMEDGIYTTGQMLIFGTGGDMEVGSVDFANMFYNPEPYRLMQFKNVWDDKVSEEAKCGFFVPDYWCKPGFIDGDGNSDTDSAKKYELKKRADLIASTSGATALNAYLTQYPFTPEEAFLRSSMNDFPVVELRTQLAKVRAEQLHVKHGQPVSMSYVDGRVALTPDLKNELTPLYHHPNKEKDTTGCVIIYEAPVPNAPKGLYKAGYDPYRQDQSQGASLGSMYVYKSRNSFSYTGDTLVAEYVGRPASTDTFNRNVMLLSMAYNLELMHENEVTEVKNYFRQQRKLHLLAAQPDAVISKNIKNSRVSRIYGCHMNDKLKDAGAKYIKKWLLTVRDHDEEGVKIINIETIKSPALLEELIGFNMKENFDRVMSLMMVMFQLEEDDYKEYKSDDKHTIAKQLADMSFFSRVAI